MRTELLSPAKNKETAIEAINCGADAVYMGAPAFGARKNVPNSLEDIKFVTEYAHKFWVRVHVTVNTILTDSELDDAVEMIYKLDEIGVDAVIIQDLGILERLINSDKKIKICIHMSTQCDNRTAEKVRFFREVGASRVILARELSVNQIKEIHTQVPDVELESFIHGALCVSYSGQCYLSRYIGGRSANRGECAQPCRKKYLVVTEDGKVLARNIYPLCLKDFNGDKHIEELKDAGICSFKIEGRLKDKGYVKNITAYYRGLLGKGTSSGRSFYEFEPNPEKSFNRGFTDYFLNGRGECYSIESPKSRGEYIGEICDIGDGWFVVGTDKTIHSQDGLYFNGDGCLVNKAEQVSVDTVKIYSNRKVELFKGMKIYRNIDTEFERVLLKPVKRQIGAKVSVAETNGETQIIIKDEDGVFVTRNIKGEKSQNSAMMRENFIKQFSKTGEEDFYITDFDIDADIPFMPVSRLNELRRTMFSDLMTERKELYEEEIRQLQKPLGYAEYYLKEVDYRANVHNESAKKFYEKCGCKVIEPSFESCQPNRQVEVMRCKHCIKYALNMCKSPIKLLLRDEYGKTYPLKFNCVECEMSLLSE